MHPGIVPRAIDPAANPADFRNTLLFFIRLNCVDKVHSVNHVYTLSGDSRQVDNTFVAESILLVDK
jgi:hypothetical protein